MSCNYNLKRHLINNQNENIEIISLKKEISSLKEEIHSLKLKKIR